MMEKEGIGWYSMSDTALMEIMGEFIKETRLEQNKTQQDIADAAGINRSTLGQIEKGGGGTIISLIQLLRVLGQLEILKSFEIQPKVSPIQLAKLAQDKRQRARNSGSEEQPEVDW